MKSTLDLFKKSTQFSPDDSGLKQFVTESKELISNTIGKCSNISQCRTMNEILYIAYSRTKALETELKYEKLRLHSIKINNDDKGISKFLIQVRGGWGLLKRAVRGDKRLSPLMKYNLNFYKLEFAFRLIEMKNHL